MTWMQVEKLISFPDCNLQLTASQLRTWAVEKPFADSGDNRTSRQKPAMLLSSTCPQTNQFPTRDVVSVMTPVSRRSPNIPEQVCRNASADILADRAAPFGEGESVLRDALQCCLQSYKLGPVPGRSLFRQLVSLQRLQLLVCQLDLTTPTAATPRSRTSGQKHRATAQGRQHCGRFRRYVCESKKAIGVTDCCLKICTSEALTRNVRVGIKQRQR